MSDDRDPVKQIRYADVPAHLRPLVDAMAPQPGPAVQEASEEPQIAPDRPDLFLDLKAFMEGTGPAAPPRVVATRDDGEALLYAGQVNLVFGDPESGKTWLADAGVAEALRAGRRGVIVDFDHNGPGSTCSRLLMLGASKAALADQSRFRYVEPEDAEQLRHIVAALVAWGPAVVVIDSIGELLPLLGLSSNQPDDFTVAHTRVLKPIAHTGAVVIAIDHLAKNTESRSAGPTGTNAKRRAVGGVSLRVTATQAFTPGRGGRALLTINKDRHGGLRAVCPPPERGEALAGTFVLNEDDRGSHWRIVSPDGRPVQEQNADMDVQVLRDLDPPPASVVDIKTRLHWGTNRARDALKAFREPRSSLTSLRVRNEERDHQDSVPRSPHIGVGTRNELSCTVCGFPMTDVGDGATTHPNCGDAS